jgi:hypothetical protein
MLPQRDDVFLMQKQLYQNVSRETLWYDLRPKSYKMQSIAPREGFYLTRDGDHWLTPDQTPELVQTVLQPFADKIREASRHGQN